MTGQYPGDDKRKGKSKETTNQFNYSPPSCVALNHFIIAWQKVELRRCNSLINFVLNQFWLCAVNYDPLMSKDLINVPTDLTDAKSNQFWKLFLTRDCYPCHLLEMGAVLINWSVLLLKEALDMMMMIMIMWTKQRIKRTDNNSGESLLLYTLAPTEVTVLRVSRGLSSCSRSSC